jgi:predicted nucleotidyltransferase
VRICFEELGNIYVEYGKKSKCGEDFTKATALYNAALTRLTNTEAKLRQHLISRIKETERHFLNSVLQQDSPIDLPNYDNDMKHKALLEKIRDDCKEVIVQVDFDCDPGLMPLNPEERVALEKRRTNLISTLFRKISEDITNFIRMLIEECTLVLGNAPCRFAVIGLGSLARNEMTPYSDLEFAILLEEGAKTESNLVYFRNITRYLHLKVLNLGETILPSMSITSLNDFYSGDPSRMWFFDDGPKGFSFDGAMPWASKSPFGRKKSQTKEALELIKTPEEMAALQSEQVAIKEGYHLADVMATSMFITGDEELVKVYNVKVKERLQAPSGEDMWTNGSKRGFECLNETFQDFSINLDWHEAGKVFNVKKELYRFPSLVLNSLTLYYNLDTRNTWDVVEEMQGKQLITEDEAHNLSFVLAVASELRLRSYLGKNEQRERMTGLPSEIMQPDLAESVAAKAGATQLDKVFHIPNPDIVFRFFMTVLPLQKAMEEFLFKKSPKEVNILSNHNLYDGR